MTDALSDQAVSEQAGQAHPTDLPINDPTSQATGCCGWKTLTNQRSFQVGLLATTLIAVVTAVYFAGVASEARRSASTAPVSADWTTFPIANATAAVSSEKFSLATGPISEQSEALFVLDHNSGLLQCSVMYPRMGRFMATFTTNVGEALGLDAKGGSYMMVTGTADLPRSSNRPLGMSLVYVMDTATGNFACYGVPFDRVAMNANRPQQGTLFLVGQGSANPVIDRDDLR